MAAGEGPQGVHINLDSYKTVNPPVAVPLAVPLVKIINGADKKYGPAKQNHHNDTYFE
jgi:hypothetical protein